MKKFTLFMLAAVLILGTAACSTKQDKRENGTQENNRQPKGAQVTSVGGSAVQYDYSSIIMNFSEYGSDIAVHDIEGQGEQIYALIEVREWGEQPEDNTQKQECTSHYYVFSCMADGSRKTIFEEVYLPEDDDGYVNELHLSDDGCVAALNYSYTEDAVSLLFRDAFRNVQWEKPIAAGGYLFVKEDGFVIIARNDNRREINFYNAQGELTDSVEAEGETFRNFQNCYFTPENRFLVIATDHEGMAYAEWYDPKTGQANKKTLPDNFSQYRILQATMTDLLLCDSTGVYQLNSNQSVPSQMLSYVDAYLDIEGFQMAHQIDGTRFAGIFNDTGIPKLGIFSRTEVPEGAQKQMVVLGTIGEPEEGLRRQVMVFNQENSRYRITIKPYITYNEELSALSQLNTDILSGKMPDILLLDSEMPLQSYISKKLLADVGKLMEEDKELDSGQFLENVLDAFRVNGTLYYVAPAFCVDTLVAKQSKAGDRTGWNQEEFFTVIAGLPVGMEMVSETSRYTYLQEYMRVCGREYVDVDQGICDFQSEAFRNTLEFSATLPEYEESFQLEENSYDSRYIEDKALLQPVTIRSIPDLAQQIYGCIGEDIAYVGYPAESREGSCIRVCGMSFALSAESDKLDGAWDFVRTFLTEDFQRDGLYGVNGSSLPIRRDIFAERAQTAATQEGYCFINGEFMPVPAMTQEQIDRAVNFLEGLHNMAFEDDVIMNIIYEEAESFFRGQKTAEDVAGMIQNRVQLYLDEGMTGKIS